MRESVSSFFVLSIVILGFGYRVEERSLVGEFSGDWWLRVV